MPKKRDHKPTPTADALRKAGFSPIPRWWVTQDQLDVIRRMALGNEGVVTEIRDQVRRDAERLSNREYV